MRVLYRVGKYFTPYKWRFAAALVSVLLAGAFSMGSPLLINFAIKYGLGIIYQGGKIVGLRADPTALLLACGAIVAFAIGRGLATFGQTYLGQAISQDAAYDIRNDVFNNVQRLSYAYHDNVETGQIMSRVTQDVEAIRMFVNMGLIRALYIAVMLALAIGGMFWINWELALVSLITLPIMTWRSFVLAKAVRPVWLAVQNNLGEVTRVAEEGLSGIRVVKAFSREGFESERFAKASLETADLSFTASKIQAQNQPLISGLGALQIAITVGFGAWLIARGTITAADLLSFALWLNLLQVPIQSVGFSLTSAARCISSGERIFELMDAQSAVQEKPDAIDAGELRGDVRFEGVGFGYDSLSAVLQDIDIEAHPGQVIALLGPPGSGKSTVVNLIPRFYDVTGGRITIDDHDVRDFTLASLRKNIGIVQQDLFLFIGTIRDNIAYGRPDASEEQIEAAARAARIHDFIVSLPYGYDEWVGERGVTLSGGQKQRIAIARTLLTDPKILILDDSTASVDMQTEFLIQQALSELMKGRTTFVIAARLRSVMRADEILVLDHGRIVERGTHSELIEQPGLYRRIFDLELRDQEEALGRYAGPRVEVAGSEGVLAAAAAPAVVPFIRPAGNGNGNGRIVRSDGTAVPRPQEGAQ